MREMGSLAENREKLHKVWFWLGFLAVSAMAVPYLLLGEDAIFTYHDQLDGELIAYILQAKHLFRGSTLPEFMGGVSKTALTLPAPGFVILFLSGHYFAALLLMKMIGSLSGYVGMYLLAREVTGKRIPAMLVGVLFAYLPFLPVYGLSQFGIPLLLWCVIQLKKGRHELAACLCVAFYTLTSSLVLVGFGLLAMGLVWLAWLFWTDRKAVLRSAMAWGLMLGLYIAENWRLLGEVLGFGGSLSHKAEYVLTADSFVSAFWQGLTAGGQHSEDYHLLLLLVTLALLLAGYTSQSAEVRRLQTVIRGCFLCNVFLASVAALWDSMPGVFLRSRLSALGAFQLDRLLWIAPAFWYLAFACALALGGCLFTQKSRVMGAVALSVMCVAMCVTGIRLLLSGDVKSNIQKLRNPDYGILSYREYYAIGVMEQAADYLREMTGKSQQEYRVVSLGIDPAAALYHGFYCLDGYSNNYPLEYKHSFRRVIAPELERSEYLRGYFDDWGNRCYLFSGECPGYYTIEKGGFYFQDYLLDAEALKALGGDYLLSAAYIANAEEQGLRLMNEAPFETEDSYYGIYVYEIEWHG